MLGAHAADGELRSRSDCLWLVGPQFSAEAGGPQRRQTNEQARLFALATIGSVEAAESSSGAADSGKVGGRKAAWLPQASGPGLRHQWGRSRPAGSLATGGDGSPRRGKRSDPSTWFPTDRRGVSMLDGTGWRAEPGKISEVSQHQTVSQRRRLDGSLCVTKTVRPLTSRNAVRGWSASRSVRLSAQGTAAAPGSTPRHG